MVERVTGMERVRVSALGTVASLKYHWLTRGLVFTLTPMATTLNLAGFPSVTVRLVGCSRMKGAYCTVNAAGGELVTVPKTLLTTTV